MVPALHICGDLNDPTCMMISDEWLNLPVVAIVFNSVTTEVVSVLCTWWVQHCTFV